MADVDITIAGRGARIRKQIEEALDEMDSSGEGTAHIEGDAGVDNVAIRFQDDVDPDAEVPDPEAPAVIEVERR